MAHVLNTVCDQHGHAPGLPDEPLRTHVLAAAIRAADPALAAHGCDVERSAEVLHVALEDSLDDDYGASTQHDELN